MTEPANYKGVDLDPHEGTEFRMGTKLGKQERSWFSGVMAMKERGQEHFSIRDCKEQF